jgi:hypothetical protein
MEKVGWQATTSDSDDEDYGEKVGWLATTTEDGDDDNNWEGGQHHYWFHQKPRVQFH